MDNESSEQLLRVGDVARILRMSPNSIRLWIREGKLPAFRINGHYLVNPHDVRAMLDAGRTTNEEAIR